MGRQLGREDVAAFLDGRPGRAEDLEPLTGAVRAEPGALRDAAARHHCYELHIGFTHLGWNVWTQNQPALAATARRLAEILERGPLPLAGA